MLYTVQHSLLKEIKMNVELTIQHMYDNYPCLFKERADCLDHLFCGIGNGYDWVNGELVCYNLSEAEIKALEAHLINGKAFQRKDDYDYQKRLEII